MVRVYYSDSKKHEIYDSKGTMTRAQAQEIFGPGTSDIQVIDILPGEAQRIQDGVLSKKTVEDLKAESLAGAGTEKLIQDKMRELAIASLIEEGKLEQSADGQVMLSAAFNKNTPIEEK